ncbi:MAG: ribonuclease H-like domain-containing protein [Bacteroidota bacterium]
MSKSFEVGKILFFDIETVSLTANYEELPPALQELWQRKAKSFYPNNEEELKADQLQESFKNKAAIFAEFGKIVCISMGIAYYDKEANHYKIRLKSFDQASEEELLKSFCDLINKHYSNPLTHALGGHNIKEFDIPFICRRLIINRMDLPDILKIGGKKPWELNYFIDTMEMWKFGDWKNYTSLKLLTAIFDIPSPKDDIDGSQVGQVYWEENDLKRISRYCEKDVLATMQVYDRITGDNLFDTDNIFTD